MTGSGGISELKVDERAAARRAEAQVKHHERREADPDIGEFQQVAEFRLVEILVKPDQRGESKHERRDLRVLPGGRDDASEDPEGVVKGFGPEENPGERDEDE